MSDAALAGMGVGVGGSRVVGARRGGDLSEPERELYRFIIRAFAAGAPPSLDDLGPDRERALDRLVAADLICRDPGSGEIAVAYPFSWRPTPHVVDIGSARVHAMCAVDALGIAFMLDRAATVTSRDPRTGEQIRVHVDPTGALDASPRDAVALAGRAGGHGAVAAVCCPVTNFFASVASARSYLDERDEVDGRGVSLAGAAAAGRTLFGDLLATT